MLAVTKTYLYKALFDDGRHLFVEAIDEPHARLLAVEAYDRQSHCPECGNLLTVTIWDRRGLYDQILTRQTKGNQ